jgi:hypothetical protein
MEPFGIMLKCFFETEPAQTETEIDPPFPAQYILTHAYIGRIDVTSALTQAQREAIEDEAEGLCCE